VAKILKKEWLEVNGFENLYRVSNYGDVIRITNEKKLTPVDNGRGYMMIHLSKNNKKKKFFIHRLVAIHFIDNPLNKRCVNHIDGDKKNNTVFNLEWSTHKENDTHARSNGLLNIKVPVVMMDKETNKTLSVFESITQAYKETGVYGSNISKACKGGLNSAGGYKWRYLS